MSRIKVFTRSEAEHTCCINAVAEPQIHCLADIIFVVDGSGKRISYYFDLMKSFLSRAVGKLDVDSGNTRVGLVIYSTDVETSFNLDAYKSNTTLIQAAISKLIYYPGGTNTAGALVYVRERMLTPQAGDRSDVDNVIVVFIDENSDNRTATWVSKILKQVRPSVFTRATLCLRGY